MTAEAQANDNRMVIRRQPEPRYWRETEDEHGHWVSTGQPGPPLTVVVTATGIRVIGDANNLRPGAARWLACRLLEATGVYESVFGGDGSMMANGGTGGNRPTLLNGGGQHRTPVADPTTRWVCGCGKGSTNKGAMAVHEKNCAKGPAVPVTS